MRCGGSSRASSTLLPLRRMRMVPSRSLAPTCQPSVSEYHVPVPSAASTAITGSVGDGTSEDGSSGGPTAVHTTAPPCEEGAGEGSPDVGGPGGAGARSATRGQS